MLVDVRLSEKARLVFFLASLRNFDFFNILQETFRFKLTNNNNINKLTSLPMCGFIAQLVEHRTGIAEVTGSNPVEALIFFFRLLLSSCLNWKIHCEDHSSLSDIQILRGSDLDVIYKKKYKQISTSRLS